MGSNQNRLARGSAIPYPKPLLASIERWRQTYAKFGGQDALPHANRVLDTAIEHRVIEIEKVGDKRADPPQCNHKLANIILAHLFRRGKDNRRDFPSQDFEKHQLVVEGFNTFDALRENDLASQDPVQYVRLLEKPSLGLLARMVDITQYGRDGRASERELAALDPKVFYFYNQKTGRSEYEHAALAARKVYGPLADLLQHRRLAGELMSISYYHLNRDIYETVKRTLKRLQRRIQATKTVMGSLKDELERHLARQGYDYTIITRERKHPGKVMEKADRYSRKNNTPIEQEIMALRDLVAFTIVLNSHNGRAITQRDITEFENVAGMVSGLANHIQPLRSGVRQCEMFNDMVSSPKPNGYQSFHVDLPFQDKRFVGLEVIIRNSRMHHYADSGGAAHYLYKGGGDEARTVQRAYRNVMHALANGTTSHLSINDYRDSTTILFVIDQNSPRQYVVPRSASVGEALVCAGMDMTRRIYTRPDISMFAPLGNQDTLWAWHGEPREPTVVKSLLNQLIKAAILETTRDQLLEMRRRVDRQLRGQ